MTNTILTWTTIGEIKKQTYVYDLKHSGNILGNFEGKL